MTTLQPAGSDGSLPPAGGGVWISISDLAKRKGIHRQSAKERVDRLVERGVLETRFQGRSRMVDLAAFDRAVGQVGDSAKEQAEETKRQINIEETPPRLRDAQTERAQYEARLKALDLAERQGELVPIKDLDRALVRAATAITRVLDQSLSWSSDLAEAAANGGQPAVSRVLRQKGQAQRQAVAKALADLVEAGKLEEAEGGTETELFEE
ncbi:hypothetical protein [Mesorhizobium sp. 1M-11]|uniref:hypothetical protein n=1 Tax=Mesorhizobium sp. 1M-11 TaxID=1529006 RepID=UPI0006C73965|nr:hypothetical protein [Mesorhizobium sp. 1M-11]